jgi:hypothetical protein
MVLAPSAAAHCTQDATALDAFGLRYRTAHPSSSVHSRPVGLVSRRELSAFDLIGQQYAAARCERSSPRGQVGIDRLALRTTARRVALRRDPRRCHSTDVLHSVCVDRHLVVSGIRPTMSAAIVTSLSADRQVLTPVSADNEADGPLAESAVRSPRRIAHCHSTDVLQRPPPSRPPYPTVMRAPARRTSLPHQLRGRAAGQAPQPPPVDGLYRTFPRRLTPPGRRSYTPPHLT